MPKTSGSPSIASLIPFGLGETKPHHYRDMLRVLQEAICGGLLHGDI